MGLPRDFRPGMHGFIPLSFNASLNQSALAGSLEPVALSGSIAPVGQQRLRRGQAAEQGGCTRLVADLACGHVEPNRVASLIVAPPFSDRRLVAMRCALRYLRKHARTNGACLLSSIITVFGTAASEARPSIIWAKLPLSPHRFHRLNRVVAGPYSLGASHHRKPLRLMKISGSAHAGHRRGACHGSSGRGVEDVPSARLSARKGCALIGLLAGAGSCRRRKFNRS